MTLADWMAADTVDDAVLVADELVSNAGSHAGGAVELTVTRYEKGAAVAVHDDGTGIDAMLEHADDAPVELDGSNSDLWSLDGVLECGRGLLLVRLLATAWCAELVETGKVVTAVFGVTEARP